jgi:hypothetical protein
MSHSTPPSSDKSQEPNKQKCLTHQEALKQLAEQDLQIKQLENLRRLHKTFPECCLSFSLQQLMSCLHVITHFPFEVVCVCSSPLSGVLSYK